MTTDLPSETKIRPAKYSDAFSMAMMGVKAIVGVAKVDGKSRFVVPVESHPDYRPAKISDAHQMAAEGVSSIRGAIENKQGTRLIAPEVRALVL